MQTSPGPALPTPPAPPPAALRTTRPPPGGSPCAEALRHAARLGTAASPAPSLPGSGKEMRRPCLLSGEVLRLNEGVPVGRGCVPGDENGAVASVPVFVIETRPRDAMARFSRPRARTVTERCTGTGREPPAPGGGGRARVAGGGCGRREWRPGESLHNASVM